MGRQQHSVCGDARRFEVVANFVLDYFGRRVEHIADVAGGKGVLTRMLNRKNYDCELIDPRQSVLKGIRHRAETFRPGTADYYDLLVGLHPDGALRALGEAALIRPVLMVPCCNFWSQERRGQKELLAAIEVFFQRHQVDYEKIDLDFKGPKNTALVSHPSSVSLQIFHNHLNTPDHRH